MSETKDKQELIPALPNFYILNYGEDKDGVLDSNG